MDIGQREHLFCWVHMLAVIYTSSTSCVWLFVSFDCIGNAWMSDPSVSLDSFEAPLSLYTWVIVTIRVNGSLKATSHTRLRARDRITANALIGGKGGAGPSSLHTTICLRDQRGMWMHDGCNVYMDSYMASNESCFMVTWTISRTISWR